MAFLIYKKYGNAETIRYEKFQPLKLSGPEGLIAKHVKSLRFDETASWKLGASSFLKLAGFGGAVDEMAVLFDIAGPDATSVCLYELLRIHGSCVDTATQLMLDFSVVVDKDLGDGAAAFLQSFEVSALEKPRLLGETLALTGGPCGGDWKWAATSLQLGATVVQAQHGHATGDPCSNCSCGRKQAMESQ
jgi:hypothetical protein